MPIYMLYLCMCDNILLIEFFFRVLVSDTSRVGTDLAADGYRRLRYTYAVQRKVD